MNVRRVSSLVVAVLFAIAISSVGALAQYGSGEACPSGVCPTSSSMCGAEVCPPPCPPVAACPTVCPPTVTVCEVPPCPTPAPAAACPPPCPAPVAVCPPPCPTAAPAAVCPPPCPAPVVAVCPEPCPPPLAVCEAPAACPPASTLSPCSQALVGYDLNSERCFEGTVVSSAVLASPQDTDYTFVMKTSAGQEHKVWLGPNSFLCAYGFNPNVGDSVAVTGAATGAGGDIIARHIMWNNRLYALRSAEGLPMWASRDAGLIHYASLWNSGQLTTFTGRVDKIYEFNPGCPEIGTGIALRVKVNGQDWETVPSWQQDACRPMYSTVHLGPTCYVKEKIARLRRGQTITVTGSPVNWCDQCVVLATQVQQGSCVVAFRDTYGRPVWPGGWQAWSPGARYASLYDPSYMRTVSGTVEDFSEVGPADGLRLSNMLTVRCSDGTMVNVLITPQWSVEQTGVQAQKGDQIIVTGPVGVFNGQQVLTASTIQVGGRVFTLQDCGNLCTWTLAQVCPPVVAVCPPAVAVCPPVVAVCP